jgi:tetratricopeptide (TPR) repeat protein
MLLRKASERDSMLLLDVAHIQEQLNRSDARSETLREALTRLSAITNPTETQYFALSEALSRLGEFDRAEKVLAGAMSKGASKVLKTALSQVYFRHAESKKEESEARIALLMEAIRVSDSHSASEAALGELAMSGAETKQKVVAKASELITKGQAIRGGHMILGVVAAQENNWNESVFHFEQALSQSPNDPALQNNLAWALAKRNTPGDAKRSLEFAELAVAKAPINADLRETRGLAWLVNRQWSPAISDFEFTLSAYPDRKHLHLLLAEAYRGLGNTQLADKHADLAK